MKHFLSNVFIAFALLIASAFTFNAYAGTLKLCDNPVCDTVSIANDAQSNDTVFADKVTGNTVAALGGVYYQYAVIYSYQETMPTDQVVACVSCHENATIDAPSKVPIAEV